jgi:hypothetical protein
MPSFSGGSGPRASQLAVGYNVAQVTDWPASPQGRSRPKSVPHHGQPPGFVALVHSRWGGRSMYRYHRASAASSAAGGTSREQTGLHRSIRRKTNHASATPHIQYARPSRAIARAHRSALSATRNSVGTTGSQAPHVRYPACPGTARAIRATSATSIDEVARSRCVRQRRNPKYQIETSPDNRNTNDRNLPLAGCHERTRG